MTQSGWIIISLLGLALGSIGGLGTELLDRFTGRSLEAFCRVKHRRERFGAILDGNEVALTASEYLRLIGTVLFLLGGTAAIFIDEGEPTVLRIVAWGISAGGLMMLTHMWLPAAVTRHASAPVLFYSWPFWRALSFTMAPLATPGKLLAVLTSRLAGNEPYESEEEEQLEDDIRTMVTAGTREGYFGPGVRDMIQGVMDLHEDTVAHIMTPRGDIIAVEASADWPSILEIASRYGRTRLPVYEETLDKIVGVLYIKDLMPYLCNGGLSTASLRELMRPDWTVPIDQNVELLLREFLHSRSHLAIVLDEFGQTAGVVTIEDVLEEIVGEIVDESDVEEESSIVVLDDLTAKADGRVMIDDLNEQLGWDLPESDDYQTVAGYILHHTGSIPEDGQRITIGDVSFEIVRATNRQIESVRLHRLVGDEREPKAV
jgi:CBS domain containing-hemolysin-like protein